MCSGRADYFGLAVNRAARFLGAACGGQVLAERGLVEEVVQYWHSLVYKYAMPAMLPHALSHMLRPPCFTNAAVRSCVHAYICTVTFCCKCGSALFPSMHLSAGGCFIDLTMPLLQLMYGGQLAQAVYGLSDLGAWFPGCLHC